MLHHPRLAGGIISHTCAAALIAFAAMICTTSFAWASDPSDTQSQQIQQEQQYIGTADSLTQASTLPQGTATNTWTIAPSHTDALVSSFQVDATFAENCDATLETLSSNSEGSANQGTDLVGEDYSDDQAACTMDMSDGLVLDASLGIVRKNVTVTGTLCYDDAHQLLEKVNQARADVGVEPLTWDSSLERTAMQRAAEITIEWSHTRPNGEACFTAFTNIQKTAGENIAMGQSTVTKVNSSWTNSAGHYANMIAAKYHSMGAACIVTSDGMHYWVESFNGGEGDSVYVSNGQSKSSFTVETLVEGATYQTASKQTYTLNIGRTETINFAADGEAAPDPSTLTFKTSDSSIASVSAKGVLTGKSPGTATITVIQKNTGYTLFTTTVTVTQHYLFDDVQYKEWFATDDILGYAVSHSLITGYSESQFGPYASITRGQVVTILWRMSGSPNAIADKFTDVDYSKYYGTAISWARVTGVVTGYDNANGTMSFMPEKTITREEFCVMLQRYTQKVAGKNASATSKMRSAFTAFSDSSKVSSWATDSVAWAIGNGLMSGEIQNDGSAKINPSGTTQRCAAAKMISILDRDVL